MRRLPLAVLFCVILLWSQTNQVPQVSLRMMDGKRMALQDLLNEGPLLIDFWALWCAPCLKAMRHLDEFQSKYGEKGFNVLAINVDTEQSQSKVRSYVKSRGYKIKVALDPSQDIYQHLNGNAMPYTLLIDQTGKIVYKHTGYIPGDETTLEQEIAALLSEGPTPSPSFKTSSD